MKREKKIMIPVILCLLVFAAAIPLAVTLSQSQSQQQPLIIALNYLASSSPPVTGSPTVSKGPVGTHDMSVRLDQATVYDDHDGAFPWDDGEWYFRIYIPSDHAPYYTYFTLGPLSVGSGETVNVTLNGHYLGVHWDISGDTWFKVWAGEDDGGEFFDYECEYEKTVAFPGTEVNVLHYENQLGYEDNPRWPGDVEFYFRYRIQNLAPRVNNVSVVDRQSNRVWFSCDVSDPEGDSIVAYEWQFGDGENSTEVNPSHEYAEPGVYNVGVRVQDYLGTWGEYKNLTVDLLPPTVDITSPTGGAILPTNDVTVSWTGSDPGLGVEHYEVSIDGGDWTSVGTSTSSLFPGLSEEIHTVQVRAFDTWGNNATYSVSFTVDITLPTVEIITPIENEEFNVSSVTVNWTASDTLFDYCMYRLDGGNWTNVGSVDGFTFTNLTKGLHTVDIMAVDEAGNNATDTITFKVILPVDFTTVLVSLILMQQSGMNPPVYTIVGVAIGLAAVVAVAFLYIRRLRAG